VLVVVGDVVDVTTSVDVIGSLTDEDAGAFTFVVVVGSVTTVDGNSVAAVDGPSFTIKYKFKKYIN